MKEYRELSVVPSEDGFNKLAPLMKEASFKKAFAILNLDGELATSTESPSAVFPDKENAEVLMKHLKEVCEVEDIYIQEIEILGSVIRMPLKGDLILPVDQPARGIAAKVLKAAFRVMGRVPYTGGCYTFYTIEQWAKRKEKYGLDSELIIVHDGGEFSNLCSYDRCDYKLIDAFSKELEKIGYWVEQCTCWYSALYKIEK